MAGIINQTGFCIGNRQLLCSHTDFAAGIVCNSNYNTHKFRRPAFVLSPSICIPAANKYYLAHVVPPAFSSTSSPRSPSISLSNLCHGAVCPYADEESPPEDAHSISSDEDPYAPPDEVAPDPPTLDWFWGQYNLCPWKSLPPAEKASQVAFKKEMAEEEARNQEASEPVMPPGKRRRRSFGGGRVVVPRRCTKTGTS